MQNAPASLVNRQKTLVPGTRILDRPKPTPQRVIGLGRTPDRARIKQNYRDGVGDFVDTIKASKACAIYNMPVVEQVRQTYTGPLLDADVDRTFGAKWDPFGAGENPAGASFVETTMAQPGQLQTYTLVCAIGLHLEPEPYCWTAQGNAWSHPAAQVQQPPSPDVFTQNDRANGALGANIAAGTEIFVPAELEWGWWINKAMWAFARAYNLRWMIGQHTNIMDEQCRHTAYMPPNAQEGSASSSQQDIIDAVRQSNDYYDSLGSALDFLKIDFLRIGSVGTGTANQGIFRKSRAFEVVGVTYGGGDLRSMLKGTSEFRALTIPYIITPGVPIGLFCQETDSVQANLMRRYLSITQGQRGTTPPLIVDQANITPTITATGAAVMLERTLDATPANVPQQNDAGRYLFKAGEFKMGLLVKGFEVDSDWADVLKADPELRSAIMNDCECAWASASR